MKASPEIVVAYLADFRRHGEWATHAGPVIEPEAAGALQAGSRLLSRGHQLGQDLDDVLTATAYSPLRTFAPSSPGRKLAPGYTVST